MEHFGLRTCSVRMTKVLETCQTYEDKRKCGCIYTMFFDVNIQGSYVCWESNLKLCHIHEVKLNKWKNNLQQKIDAEITTEERERQRS